MSAMSRLHAVATQYGITHDELHAWAIANFDVESLREVPATTLDGLATLLDNPAKATEFRWKYRVPVPANEPLFTPDQWQALNNEADAIAERFRA